MESLIHINTLIEQTQHCRVFSIDEGMLAEEQVAIAISNRDQPINFEHID